MLSTPRKLKASEVAVIRARLATEQGGRCKLCQGKFGLKAPLDPVLDHDHSTGAIRGVLHRGCNSLLGKVENNAGRYGVYALFAFCHGLAPYLQAHGTNITGLIHPTFKTDDEKRVARNAKARKVRAAKKKDTA